jgi:hypothetical protein
MLTVIIIAERRCSQQHPYPRIFACCARSLLLRKQRVEFAPSAVEDLDTAADEFDVAAACDLFDRVAKAVQRAHPAHHELGAFRRLAGIFGTARRLAMGLQQFATLVGDRVNALAVDVAAAHEIAIVEHLQRGVDRAGTGPEAAAFFDGQHDLVAVTRAVGEDGEHVVFHAAPLALREAAVAMTPAAASRAHEAAAQIVRPEEVGGTVAPGRMQIFKSHGPILFDISFRVNRRSGFRRFSRATTGNKPRSCPEALLRLSVAPMKRGKVLPGLRRFGPACRVTDVTISKAVCKDNVKLRSSLASYLGDLSIFSLESGEYLDPRLSRRVLSHVVKALLLVPLSGCAALQEPGQSLTFASLRDQAQRVAEAATLTVERSVRPHTLADERPAAQTSAYTSLSDSTVFLTADPLHVAFAKLSTAGHLRLSNYRLAFTPQALEAAYGYRARTARAMGDRRAEARAMTKWLALAPANPAGWLRLANLQAGLHDEPGALTSVGIALRYNPDNGSARLEQAQLLQQLGRPAAALAAFTAYRSQHRGAPDASVLRMEIDAARDAKNHIAALAAIDTYIAVAPDDVAMLRARGDELAANGDDSAAIAAWKAYADRRPADVGVLKQIAYASEHIGDLPEAVWALGKYVRARPDDDRLKLALAYDQAATGHPDLALAAFAALQKSPDTSVATQAAAELRARMGGASGSSRAAYVTLQYDSRFANTLLGIDTYALAPARRIQPYAVLHSWADTRSSTHGSGAIVYNDNAETFGGGLRYNLGLQPNQFFFVEAGEEVSLLGRGTSPQLQYGFASWSERGTQGRGHTSYGFSIGSFSRYGANVIGYSNILHDFPLSSSLRGVVGTNFAVDTHRDYWNNVGEIELGVKIGSPRFAFTLAGIGGVYLPRGGVVPKRFYSTLRPSIAWSPHL